jgi:crotonobetainyl-CoA:carnitine CoA-transferase CaiB-like acyl-CoA transferase
MGTSPLEELRILDLSRLLPGPYCTMIFSNFGAEVIRIEPPDGGDWLREAGTIDASMQCLFQILNLGKKSLSLNLKSQEGRQIFLKLVKTTDVLFETFRPGVMERMGVGYEELCRVNQGLIYCSLTGYGKEGAYRERVGHDLNYIGLTGLLDLTGHKDGPPIIPATQVADIMGGLWAAIGILIALKSRQHTGRGMRVDGSLLGAALASLPVEISRNMGGKPTGRGLGELSGGVVCYNVYETKDGEYMTLAALEPRFWLNFCRTVEKEHLVGRQYAKAAPGEEVYEEIVDLFLSLTKQEWVSLLSGVEACCDPIEPLEHALVSEPIQSLEMFKGNGLYPPIRLSNMSEPMREGAPQLGQHASAILHELGYSDLEIERLRRENIM